MSQSDEKMSEEVDWISKQTWVFERRKFKHWLIWKYECRRVFAWTAKHEIRTEEQELENENLAAEITTHNQRVAAWKASA